MNKQAYLSFLPPPPTPHPRTYTTATPISLAESKLIFPTALATEHQFGLTGMGGLSRMLVIGLELKAREVPGPAHLLGGLV